MYFGTRYALQFSQGNNLLKWIYKTLFEPWTTQWGLIEEFWTITMALIGINCNLNHPLVVVYKNIKQSQVKKKILQMTTYWNVKQTQRDCIYNAGLQAVMEFYWLLGWLLNSLIVLEPLDKSSSCSTRCEICLP